MIQIRSSLFETNSSSVSLFVIPKDCIVKIPTMVNLEYDNYSNWEYKKYIDTLNFAYSMCVDLGGTNVARLIEYLKRKGVVIIRGDKYTKNPPGEFTTEGYPLQNYFKSEKLFDMFCFGDGSCVHKGNDNEYREELNEETYDKDKYITISLYE